MPTRKTEHWKYTPLHGLNREYSRIDTTADAGAPPAAMVAPSETAMSKYEHTFS